MTSMPVFVVSVVTFATILVATRLQLAPFVINDVLWPPANDHLYAPSTASWPAITTIVVDGIYSLVLGVFHLWPLAWPRSSWRSALASLIVLIPRLFISESDAEVHVAGIFAGLWLAVICTYWAGGILRPASVRRGAYLGVVSLVALVLTYYVVIMGLFTGLFAGISIIWLLISLLSLRRDMGVARHGSK